MKLTKEELKRIINEELEATMEEGLFDFLFKKKKKEPAKQDKKGEEASFPSDVLSNSMGIVWDKEKYPNIPEPVSSLAAKVNSYGMGPGDAEVNKKLQSELAKLDKATENSDNMDHVRIQRDLDTWQGDAISFMTGEDTRGLKEGE